MSEWKWCENCGHRYDLHPFDPDVEERGLCTFDGCDCTQFYTDPANFF